MPGFPKGNGFVRTQCRGMWVKRRLSAVFAALLLALAAASPARATGTLFYFLARDDGGAYSLELVGREDPGAVQLRWHGLALKVLPQEGRELEFDREEQRLVFRFADPGDSSLPPSFAITVNGADGWLEFDGRKIPGEASWDIW